jgi:hypothetical protein
MAKKTQKRSKLAPALLLGGLAGGVVTALRKRGVVDKAPDSVKQAASQAAGAAGDLAQRAKDAAPEPVKQAVDKVADAAGQAAGNGTSDEAARRYAAPAEAGSQPPAESGEAPSDDPQATVARTAASDGTSGDTLLTKPHDLPADTVMPDVSDDDPTVRAAEAAAAADAGSIGGNVDALAADEPGFTEDPERRPVIEGSGDPDEQTVEELDRDLGGNRETQP